MAMVNRAPSGHRCGSSHHRASIDFSVVERARKLREKEGASLRKIAQSIGVSMWTVRDWVEYRTRVKS